MQRVHRKLSRQEVEALRNQLTSLVPESRADIPHLLRNMRLIARMSQPEYAKLCGVAPRVLAEIEAGRGNPRIDTLTKLLKPFGYSMGVVAKPLDDDGQLTQLSRKR